MTTTASQPTKTYELCYDPREGDVLVYRMVHAGICGPFSPTVACESREQAEQIARDWGYIVSDEWQSHTNYDSAPLVRL